MPPQFRFQVFKKQGTQDEGVAVKGDEFKRCLKLFKRKSMFVWGLIFTVCTGGAPFLMNVFMGDMMNVMTQDQNFTATILDLCVKMVYVVLAMAFVTALAIFMRTIGNPAFNVDLRSAVYDSLLELDIEFFDSSQTGSLIGRLSEDVTVVRETYIDKFLEIVQLLSQAVIGVLLALFTAWCVCLSCLPGVPLAAVTFVLGEVAVGRLWFRFNERSSATSAKAEEVITQFRTVKAFDCEIFESDVYSQNLEGIHDVYKTTSYAHAVKDGLIMLYLWLMIAGLMYYTLYIIVKKPYLKLEPGDMMILMMSLMLGTMGISQAMGMIDDFKKAAVAAAKLLEIIDKKPNVDRHEGDYTINGQPTATGRVEFRDVGFKYATREDFAVRHLTFTVEPGETVAFVGESGCGKSTTLQLMQRFYEIQEGQILIDRVDIKTLAPEFIRSQTSVVPQGPVLFSMSVRDNIRYAKIDATDEEVATAAQTGNAHEFILEMPQNYETRVQQTSLSGGQKQRICISRAILQDAPIMLLDEATAALDTESEQLVQQSLEQVRHGKTAIVVAYRLATVMHADRIFVFREGHIEETGKHEELLAREGIYADLVRFQLQ
jgi:ABC-type multidrug transport system fused ATPase/permease subunit